MKFDIEKKFFLEQKTGWQSPSSPEIIPKYLLKKYLPANPVSIDCGAHNGSDSIELRRVLGGTVHSFEPMPVLFDRLKRHASKYTNILCYPVALGDRTGTQAFYVSEGASDASSSLLEPGDHVVDHPETYFKDKIDVEVLTLDEWGRRNNIRKVDLLWLDMQGFELNMLEASTEILDTVSAIHTEVSTKETYKGVRQYSEYRDFLRSKGFMVVQEAIPAGWDMGNVLFVKRELCGPSK